VVDGRILGEFPPAGDRRYVPRTRKGHPVTAKAAPRDELPAWASVLAVVAHPDDESFGLGALLDAFRRAGSDVSVLCLTHGEASTLHGVPGELDDLRARELREAAAVLGLQSAVLSDHPDGALTGVDPVALAAEVHAAVDRSQARGLLVFDPTGVTGHPDHVAATVAALHAAATAALPVLGWTIPAEVAERLNEELGTGFIGHDASQVDLVVGVDRTRQRTASLAHASQSLPTSVLWRRLELLGDVEHLRWLRPGPRPS
jgi:N-acetylglucosamine malate deacetylase 2